MYFAKLINAAFLPSQNHKFVDTETQCYFILRCSTGYVSRGVIDWALSTIMVDDLFKTNRWFSRYVIAAMLVDENKRFLINSFCSSTSNCTLQHCYLWP